ncbi:hypothetical protein EON82_16445 [bacterium]|nr:MAG: hypothetical protein EON82_16445 [bacterium]
MPPEIDWKPLPSDPRTLVVWTLRALPAQVAELLLHTLVVLAFVAMVALFCAFGAVPDLSSKWSWPRKRRKAPSVLASLVPLPSREASFPVSVRVWCHGVRTGSDEGMVAFFDGWLIFEGRRTAFSLRNVDTLSLTVDETRLRMVDGRDVEILPYDRMADRRDLREPFEVAVRRWMRSGIPEGRSVLPPMRIQPWAWGQATGATLTSVLFTAGALAIGAQGSYPAWSIAAVVALCGLWKAARGLADLRALTRRCIRCAPRCASVIGLAGTPSSPCRPDRFGAWR